MKEQISAFHKNQNNENFLEVMKAIVQFYHSGKSVYVPVLPTEDGKNQQLGRIETDGGVQWVVACTDEQELKMGGDLDYITMPVRKLLPGVQSLDKIEGILWNPWTENFALQQLYIQGILNSQNADGPKNKIFFEIGNICEISCDAIVNAANKSLLGGGGVDGAIHRAAGKELLEECRLLGGCKTGEAKMTKAYRLPARFIIHTVGPIYSGSPSDEKMLASCYENSLNLALEKDLHSIAFPAISCGVYGYPHQEAAAIAYRTVTGWLKKHEDYGMEIIFSCFDEEMYQTYMKVVSEQS